MMTRPVKVREAMGTMRDTTMSSSWGTCNGRTWRWQDILNVAKALNSGGVQGSKSWWNRALAWPEQLAMSWQVACQQCWGTAVGLPKWWGNQNAHLECSPF